MADAPKITDQGIAADLPPQSEHVPGAADPDSSEPQIPRVASSEAGPGDRARARGDEPVGGAGRAAGASAGRGDPASRTDADGRPVLVQPVQQQQAQATPGGPQETSIEGPGYPTEDMDDVEDDEDDGEEDEEFADVEDNADDVQMIAPPELGDAPIEAEDGDTSIVGDGHADKAAWNRERIAAMQSEEATSDDPDSFGSQDVMGHGRAPDTNGVGLGDAGQIRAQAGRTPGSSEDMGYGGGAPNEDVDLDVPGLDTGDGRLDELADDTDLDEDEALDKATEALDDDAGLPAGRTGQRMAPDFVGGDDSEPGLPESREFSDTGVSIEERLLADDDEDAMFADGEMGTEDDLEMEELNEIDDIANDFEDQRVADDSMDGNEERTWRRD